MHPGICMHVIDVLRSPSYQLQRIMHNKIESRYVQLPFTNHSGGESYLHLLNDSLCTIITLLQLQVQIRSLLKKKKGGGGSHAWTPWHIIHIYILHVHCINEVYTLCTTMNIKSWYRVKYWSIQSPPSVWSTFIYHLLDVLFHTWPHGYCRHLTHIDAQCTIYGLYLWCK